MRPVCILTAEHAEPAELVLLESVHQSPDSVRQDPDIEVQEQPYPAVGQLEVRKKLRLMDREDPLDGLDLNDHHILDLKIDPIAAVEQDPLLDQRHRLLSHEGQPAKPEFVGQARLVAGLQLPWPDLAVNLNGCSQDRSGHVVDIHPTYLFLEPGLRRREFGEEFRDFRGFRGENPDRRLS